MHAIERHLASHHGVISHAEALKLGMSKRTISRRVTHGRWLRLHRGVYRLSGAPPVWLGDARASALACAGLISHRAAARVWAIDGFDRAHIELTIDVDRRARLDGRVRLHRSTQMHLAGRTERRAVPVTGAARTVLDLAAVLPRNRLHEAVDAVLRQRLLRWHDLLGVLVRHSRQGRDGCGKLRALLDERYGEARPPDSAFNRMVGQLLIDAGVGRLVFEHEIFDGTHFVARVDLAFPSAKLAIELDSRRFHDNELSFVADRRRANRLVNLGWTVLAFTYDDYRDAPFLLVQTVRDALRRLGSVDPVGQHVASDLHRF